jgi:hypothetical protein
MSIRKKRVAPEAAFPSAPTGRRRLSPSRFVVAKVALLFLGLGAATWFFISHPMSPTRHVILIAAGVCIFAFAVAHKSNERHLLVVAIEYAIVATFVAALVGGMAPQQPAPHAKKTPKQTDAGFDPSQFPSSLAATCHKVDSCAQLLRWLDEQRKAAADKAGLLPGGGE